MRLLHFITRTKSSPFCEVGLSMGRGLGFGLLLGLGLGLELGPFLTGPLNLPSDDGERHLNCTLFLSILIFYRPVSSLAFALLRENCAHAQMRSRARRGGQGKSPHPAAGKTEQKAAQICRKILCEKSARMGG